MRRKMIWFTITGIVIATLALAACGPTTTTTTPTTPTEPTKPTQPTTPAQPTTPTEPAATTPTTAGPEMVKVTLKKKDGTTVEKTMEKPKYGGTFSWAGAGDVYYFDEAYGLGGQARWPMNLILEELLMADWNAGPTGTGELSMRVKDTVDAAFNVGILAESWEIVDDGTVLFRLRKGIRFQDKEPKGTWTNRELTADDYVHSYKRVMAGPTSWQKVTYSAEQQAAFSATVVDKYTAKVTWMKGRIGEVLRIGGDYLFITAKDLIVKFGDMRDWRNTVGTGPYMLTDYVSMSTMILKRNPNYWRNHPMFPEDPLPYVDTIKWLIIPDAATRLTALRTGKIDWMPSQAAENAQAVMKTNPEIIFKKVLWEWTSILPLRVNDPKLPYYDKRVRHALQMGLDMEEIKNTLYKGEAMIKPQPISYVPEFSDLFLPLNEMPQNVQDLFKYNPGKAKELLAEAGYPNGFKATATIVATAEEIWAIVASYWAKIGVEVKFDIKEAGAWYGMLNNHTIPEMTNWYFIDDTPRTMNNWRPVNIMNQSGFNDPVLNKAYDEVEAAFFDWKEIGRIYREITAYSLDQAYHVYLPTPYLWDFWQPWVKGYNAERSLGCYNEYNWMAYLWIDQDLKYKMTGYR